jgi:hypothetical protein
MIVYFVNVTVDEHHDSFQAIYQLLLEHFGSLAPESFIKCPQVN